MVDLLCRRGVDVTDVDPDSWEACIVITLVHDGVASVVGIDDPHNIGPRHAKKTRRGRSPHIALSSCITNGFLVNLNSTCGTCSWNETDVLIADAEAISIE